MMSTAEVIWSVSMVWRTMNGSTGKGIKGGRKSKPTARRVAVDSGGFTYMTVLILIAVTGVALIGVSRSWRTIIQREKEAELLFRGNAIQKAIESYCTSGDNQYPRALTDLLQDPRSRTVKRHLRKIYPEPFAKDGKWSLIQDERGYIIGVHSGSKARPLKTDNFSSDNKSFRKKKKYSDWKFVYKT